MLLIAGFSFVSIQVSAASNASSLYGGGYERSVIHNDSHSGASNRFYANSQAGKLSKAQAIKQAEAKYKGKVLSAKKIKQSKTPAYKVKILLPDGRVKNVTIR